MRYLMIILMIFLISCTRSESTKDLLEDQGYENVEITGYRFFQCNDNELFRTGFKAENEQGNEITGTVCSGFFSSTIRYDN